MSRLYKIAIVIFLLLVAFLTYIEATEPEPVNWNLSYSALDKIPMGTFVLHETLEQEFEEVLEVKLSPYEFLQKNEPEGTYVFINNQLGFDNDELEDLLEWVAKGNTLFLASDAFSKNLLDTLGLNTGTKIPTEGLASQPMMELMHPKLKGEQAYLFDKDTYHSVFIEMDSVTHTILGQSQLYAEELVIENPSVNYVAVDHGEGKILLHTSPQAFTNYFILHEQNYEYVAGALAYLPKGENLYWDEYKKAGKSFQTSPLFILLGDKHLKWAYYFTLAGVLLFILFEGKRKQRAIPVVKPLENQTYNFTRTIAGLYLDRKDYKPIASKKIALFLEYIRLYFRIPTSSLDEDFFSKVSAQSQKPVEEVKAVFRLIKELESQQQISREQLLALNAGIDSLKTK